MIAPILKQALALFYFEVEELDNRLVKRKLCLPVVNSKSQQQCLSTRKREYREILDNHPGMFRVKSD